MSAQKSRAGSKKAAPPDRTDTLGKWPKIALEKPKVTVKTGEAKRQAEEELRKQRPSWLQIALRLLPVWVLLLIVIAIEPALPIRAIGAAAKGIGSAVAWAIDQFPERPPAAPKASDPVFIVEGASPSEIETSEPPPPNWDLNIARVFSPSVQYWADDIARWSLAYRVKPNFIATIMQIESCGDPTAVSDMDALGLFQVLRPYFAEGEDPYDPDLNAYHAMRIVEELMATVNGDPGLTFAAYNGGAPILFVSPTEWPEETQAYQYWASGIYEEAERGLKESPTLQDWLNAGGSSLCEQADTVLKIDE